MVEALDVIQKKWDIGIVDMYRDEDFNNISEEKEKEYMADWIHPTEAGYVEWWTPFFEEYLIEYLNL